MKILCLAVGKDHDPLFRDAIQEFTTRVNRYAACEWRFVPHSDMKEEASKILRACEPHDYVVYLDDKAKQLSSEEFAAFLDARLNDSVKRIVFIIGGAYGADKTVHERANSTLSLSKLTFPHQLVRLILSEQLYRAFTILKGEQYHHS